jgi:hypothetical protein
VFSISHELTNVGFRAADEVVMAFFVPLDIPRSEPASKLGQQMFDFEWIHVTPSSSSTIVSFEISLATLQVTDKVGSPLTFPGQYLIYITNRLDIVQQTVRVKNKGLICCENLP